MTTENPRVLFHIKAKCILNSSAFLTNEDTLSFDPADAMPFAHGTDCLIYLAKLIHRRAKTPFGNSELDGQLFQVYDAEGKLHHSVSLS